MHIFSVSQEPKSEAGRLMLRFLDPTHLDTHKRARATSPLNSISLSQRPLPTHHTRRQASNIHAFS
jgi:hypothetical protein